VCQARGIWLHVDAAWGGAAAFSAAHSGLIAGISGADSVLWNLHKAAGVPLQCSALLTRHPGALAASASVAADYLFHGDGDSLDLGTRTMGCGRRVDGLKAWLLWR
jgi:glutamate/tyrosine decarboxylase-like PLP-dependent enzyme